MTLKNLRPRLAITIGDPAGIGPEVVLKALLDPRLTTECEITVIGSRSLLEGIYRQFSERGVAVANPGQLNILEGPVACEEITVGTGNGASGAASFAYLKTAITKTRAGDFDGIVTGPIAKVYWKAAGHDYPGQTELLAEGAGVNRFGMLFVAKSPHTGWMLRALLATTHIPLAQVSTTLTPQLLTTKLELLVECLQQDFGLRNPKIAVAGLNPHSGENGQLGMEEKEWLIPWLEAERHHRPELILEGPVPPDTLWVKPGQAWFGNGQNSGKNTADAYLAMYHDQGLIPVKLMAFDRAVNTTIGLPFIRTSPDHGTAFDIAGKGIADASSMQAAIELAAELVRQRMK